MNERATDGGKLASDEETGEFLSAVAAESVNDAIQFVAGLDSRAEPLLREALRILIEESMVEGKPAAQFKPELSAQAIDLLVAQRLREDSAERAWQDKSPRMHPHAAALEPDLQKAIALMIEAMSFLDRAANLHAVTHLQFAVDRALEGDCASPGHLGLDHNETRSN